MPEPETKKTWLAKLGFALAGFAIGALLFGAGADDSSTTGKSDAGPGANAINAEGAPHEAVWTCSMHPQIRESEPGSCPICGMDLVEVKGADTQSQHEMAGSMVILSERAKTLAKLQTEAVVRRKHAQSDLHLLGRIEPNEESQKTVTAWAAGRIERLHVDSFGEEIKAGQAVATIYSPETYAAHQDLIAAKKQVTGIAESPESSRLAAESALETTRERLRLLGIPKSALKRMEGESKPRRSVRIRSPYSGTVLERIATEGAYLSTGDALYRVAKLDTLWVQLDAYESDLSQVSVGQRVELKVDALEGEQFAGEVTFIDPIVDLDRRTVRVRVEVANADGRLRPGMFAQAILKAEPDIQNPLVVPATAPLFTGRRALVFVETDHEGTLGYAPRTVRLGPRSGDEYRIIAGLREGERVVTRGAFALDADLQIKGGRSMMASPDDTEPGAWDMVTEIGSGERAQLLPVLQAYLALQRALAADDLPAGQAAAALISTRTKSALIARPPAAKRAWQSLAAELTEHAAQVTTANDLEDARGGFEKLSTNIQQFLRHFGNLTSSPLHLAFCPMAMDNKGAAWVQRGADIDNPYFGPSMNTCGDVEEVLEMGAYLMMPSESSGALPMPAGGGGHNH